MSHKNLSDSSVKLTNTPTHKLFAHANWLPIERSELHANIEAEKDRTIGYRQAKGTPDAYPTLAN